MLYIFSLAYKRLQGSFNLNNDELVSLMDTCVCRLNFATILFEQLWFGSVSKAVLQERSLGAKLAGCLAAVGRVAFIGRVSCPATRVCL